MRSEQLEEYVIQPTLDALAQANPKLNTKAAVNLLLGTCAQETRMGQYIKQIGGPALGIFQVEPDSHFDITSRYLARSANFDLKAQVTELLSRDSFLGEDTQLVTNLRYNAAICRIKYWMIPEPLPQFDDLDGLAEYWDKFYNANDDHGTVDEFKEAYARYVKQH